LRNLAKAYNVAFDARSSLSSIAERLLLGEHITYHQHDLVLHIIEICNLVTQGVEITPRQAREVFAVAETVQDEYGVWLEELLRVYSATACGAGSRELSEKGA